MLRRRVEDFLELFAKAHVEHLVGLVEHRHAQRRKVERAAFEMVAEPPGVPTTMCAPPASARRSFIGSMPPTQVTTRAPALA